jgi:hypothetical protein
MSKSAKHDDGLPDELWVSCFDVGCLLVEHVRIDDHKGAIDDKIVAVHWSYKTRAITAEEKLAKLKEAAKNAMHRLIGVAADPMTRLSRVERLNDAANRIAAIIYSEDEL